MDTIKIKNTTPTNTIDSIKVGDTFYRNDSFIGYKYIESEPYEFIELNEKNTSTQLMIYSKSNNNYVVLISAEDIVDKYDYDWEKLNKTVLDIVSFDARYEICWYLYDGNHPPNARFGIGTNSNKIRVINESFDCELYEKYKIFDVDYRKGKIIEIDDKNVTFCCSDGY